MAPEMVDTKGHADRRSIQTRVSVLAAIKPFGRYLLRFPGAGLRRSRDVRVTFR